MYPFGYDGCVAVSQIDSPAPVAQHFIAVDFNTFHIFKNDSKLIVMNQVSLNYQPNGVSYNIFISLL